MLPKRKEKKITVKMYKQRNHMRCFQTIPDSDQSISDEEESGQHWPKKCLTLDGSAKKKEELPLSSRLEILKGAHVDACNLEDDVSSGDEKDDIHSIGSDKEDGSYTWSAASKEVEALMRLNEKNSCSSSHSAYLKLNKLTTGVKGKGKPKFSFRFPTHKEGNSWLSAYNDDSDVAFNVKELPERLDSRTKENSDAELLEDIQGEEENQLEIVPFQVNEHGHGCIEQSMAELLDGLQDKATMTRGSSKMCLLQYSRKRRKRGPPVVKRVRPPGDRLIDGESSPEHLGPESPSHSEADDQILKIDKPEVKRQTLVDRFQEALSGRALVTVPKTLRIGLFGQLQQVVQSEKESDMEFLKNIENGANQKDPSCIDVKIRSRHLDANLTVCHCSFGNRLKVPSLPWSESPKHMLNEETTQTVIFNPRVCNDVDLDAGKWIRIHTPWKEIHVGNDKSIILSSYFSEI